MMAPKTAAERQRQYRARLQDDPEKREAYLQSDRERWRKRVESGKCKGIKDLRKREQRQKRKKWRAAYQRSKERRDALKSLTTPPDTPEQSPEQTDHFNFSGGNYGSQFADVTSTMSELFMECVEEDLEPWQKQVPQVHLIEDDDDEPIFVGVLSSNHKDGTPNPALAQKNSAGKPEMKHASPHPTAGPSPIVLPLSVPVTTVNTAPLSLTTVTPRPVIVNNQGFIVTSPQLTNNSDLIATLGSQYPPGTSFTIVPAGQQQLFQQVSPATVLPGVVHRPQVQQIRNNVVTLSNVQSPAVYSTQSKQSNSHTIQSVYLPVKDNSWNKDQSAVKRGLMSQEVDGVAKKAKLDLASAKVTVKVENGLFKKNCPTCHEEILTEEAQKYHMMRCRANLGNPAPSSANANANKLIMLVSDFYYGRFIGDVQKKDAQKTNTTFKCQSCLKILKNNIRFMNHMKHHLELEKQNSESWESYTTCQHCYRQYMTPFQLQCHIESAHGPIESSTICKICELAFESEQVLLEHMKANHKPGEMPYVCQVCNYRSSFFSDVEAHFRTVHENTKDLLCPFCLKVVRTSHIYMQHYMKHQKKGIHRCGKCRLNFLTYKEKVEHRTHVHKTFRKPKALEGLPPGTKVTIRASFAGKMPVNPVSPDRSAVTVGMEMPSFSHSTQKSSVGGGRSRTNDFGAGRSKNKTEQNKKQERRFSKHNLALKDLSVGEGCYTCIECNGKVDDFFAHFPMLSCCGACSYRTSCKISIGNHMIKFHSNINKQRFLKMSNKTNALPSRLTLVCINCKLLVEAAGGDLMTKHLTAHPDHICQVIQEKDNKTEDKDQVEAPLQQPETVQISPVTTSPAMKPEEIHLHEDESVSTESVAVATTDQRESEPKLSASDQENDCTEKVATEGTSEDKVEEEVTQSVLSAASSCTSDTVLDLCDDMAGPSEGLQVQDQLPVLEALSDHATEEEDQNQSGPSNC